MTTLQTVKTKELPARSRCAPSAAGGSFRVPSTTRLGEALRRSQERVGTKNLLLFDLGNKLLRVHLTFFAWAFPLALLGAALATTPPEGPEVALWLLKSDQLTDAPALLTKLREGADPLSDYLREACEPATQELLDHYQSRSMPSPELIEAIVADLNRIMREDCLYDNEFFDEFSFSKLTWELLGKELKPADLTKLNRRLLEDAYSNEIEPVWTLPFFVEGSDLLAPRALALTLLASKDPLARYLRDSLKPTERQELLDYTGAEPPKPSLLTVLVTCLNQAVLNDTFYDKDRFSKVTLTKKTRQFAESKPEGDYLRQLNRLLLEEAYPEAIRRHAPAPIEVQADSLEYDRDKNLMVGSGHVRVRKDLESLRSDQAIINLESLDVLAEGNVTFERGSEAWVGKKLRYNFRTQKGDFGGFDAYLEPFYIKAESSRRIGPDEYLLDHAKLSTCEGDNPAAWFRARKVRIVPGKHIRAQHVVLYVKGVPVMYSPFWNQNIGDRNFITLVPGYNSRMYAFLLTAFNYRLSRKVEATTRVDVRARRGVGVGQDILWSASGNAKGRSTERYSIQADDDFWYFGRSTWLKSRTAEEEDPWAGDLITYYAQDAWPDEGKDQTYKIDNERYRLRLYHNQSFDEQNYFLSQLEYLSDYKLIEQYFRKEFKNNPEPYNYLLLGHRTEHYTASLKAEKRFNDFYTTVDRVPELALDFQRQKIFETPFYYKGKTAGTFLEKNWEANLATNLQDYAAGRFDSAHTLYYPTKQAGFLNITPYAGWRGTWYSKTKEDYTNLTTVMVLDTNNVAHPVTTTNILYRDKEARFRSLPEVGMETSFKAFKVWETYPGDIVNNLRHIAEPYANYTLIPEPDVTTNALYQFDEIDTLGRVNEIKLGMRNKIQTQRFNKRSMKSHAVYDLLNADLWVVYRLDPRESENLFSNVNFNVRSTPFDWLELKIDGAYDQYTNQLETINTRLTVQPQARWKYTVEHRYNRNSSSLLNNDLTFTPFVNWEYSVYTRYEFETGDMEAWGLTVQRTLDCIAYKLGTEFQDDEYTFWIQFWFTEFPKVRMDIGL